MPGNARADARYLTGCSGR